MPWSVATLVLLDFEPLTLSDVDDKDSKPSSMGAGRSVGKSRTTLDDSECPLRSGDAICDHDL